MAQDATSESSEQTTETQTSATEDDIAQQMLADATATDATDDTTESTGDEKAVEKPAKPSGEDKLGDSGKRALASERRARREAEKQLNEIRTRLQQFEDRDKTEIQKAIERAEAAEQNAVSLRVTNTRLIAAATYNLDPDLMDLLGDGSDEEINARAKVLAEKFASAKAAAASPQPADKAPASAAETKRGSVPASTRPVESLTPGAKPASQQPDDPDAWIRRMAGRT